MLIELGEQHGRLPEQVRPPAAPPQRFRAGFGVAAAVLLVLLGGSAALPPPTRPVVVPARLGDTMFVGESLLHLVSPGPPQTKIISRYRLPDGALLDRTTAAVTGAVFQVTSEGDTVLVTYQQDTAGAEATVALAAGTARVLWSAPARLLSVSEAPGLVLLRENNPESDAQRWYGVDLATGLRRWTLRQPPLAYTTEAGWADGFPRRLITATTAGHIEVRDTTSGAVLAAADVPVPVGWAQRAITVWPAGDLILVGGEGGVTAYGLTDLRERWRNTLDLSARWIQEDCGGEICVFSYRGGVQVVDPATGRTRWSDDHWTAAGEAGPYLLFTGNEGVDGNYPLAVLDPATGTVLGDFGAWQFAGGARADGTFVGKNQRIGDESLWYALLDPATRGVRVLGMASGVAGDCRAAGTVLVCRRIDASVTIWPLTAS